MIAFPFELSMFEPSPFIHNVADTMCSSVSFTILSLDRFSFLISDLKSYFGILLSKLINPIKSTIPLLSFKEAFPSNDFSIKSPSTFMLL